MYAFSYLNVFLSVKNYSLPIFLPATSPHFILAIFRHLHHQQLGSSRGAPRGKVLLVGLDRFGRIQLQRRPAYDPPEQCHENLPIHVARQVVQEQPIGEREVSRDCTYSVKIQGARPRERKHEFVEFR